MSEQNEVMSNDPIFAELSREPTQVQDDEAPKPVVKVAPKAGPGQKYVRRKDGSVWFETRAANGNVESHRVDFPHGVAPKGVKV